ncbi:MAG: hypothetical protein U0263_41040 [Polyangiaceae bacterium]
MCVTASSGLLDGEGPAKGYCSVECTSDETICDSFDTSPVCVSFENGKAYCFEGCDFGPTTLTSFSPNKCHGREEVACRPFYDDQGVFSVPGCFPQCNSDADCGGLKCNPKTGLCGATTPTGKAIGEACTQTPDPCRGACIQLTGPSSKTTYMCMEGCTAGATASCGWSGPGTPAPAACLFAPTTVIENGGTGFGDLGSCAPMCNCNADCKNTALSCLGWTGANASALEQYYGKKGYCGFPDTGDVTLPTCN